MALAFAGWAAHAGIAEADAAAIVAALVATAGTHPDAERDDPADRLRAVQDTYAKHRAGEEISGYSGLRDDVGLDRTALDRLDAMQRRIHDRARNGRGGAATLTGVTHVTHVTVLGGKRAGAELLEDVAAFLGRFVAYPSDHAHVAHTLWIAHTHLMAAWDTTPRLAFLSPEPASGKTRGLEVSELLVPDPVQAINISRRLPVP